MTEPTRTQTETSDGLLLKKVDYFRRHLASILEAGEKVTIHSQSHGLVTIANKVKIKDVSDDGVTLVGQFLLLLGPSQAQQQGGVLFLPLIDIMRVMQLDEVQIASDSPKA